MRLEDLPPDVAEKAQAAIAAGHFSSVEELVRAGIERVTEEYGSNDPAWIAYARSKWESSVARGGSRPIESREAYSAEIDRLVGIKRP